jgi:membrane-associated protein
MLNHLIDWVIENGGIYVMLFIIFAETGLFLGFFLPGDSLLFAAGIYVNKLSASFYNVHYSVIILLIIIASVLGNMAGYWFGNKTGPVLYERKETFLFRRKHLIRAHDFYEQYGKATIFLAKFLPIIRTFAPIVAGVVKMPKATFTLYNILGSIVWVTTMVLGGHFLESWVLSRYGFSLKEHIDVIAIIIILVTTLPVLFKLFFGKKKVVDTNVEVDTNVK